MPKLRAARSRTRAAAVMLLVADIALLVYLLSPLRPRPSVRQAELEQARSELELKQKQVAPLLGMDEKLQKAQVDLDQFYRQRFAARGSAIAAELGKLAAGSGVQLSGARYENEDSGVAGLARVKVQVGVEGAYPSTVKFINGLERDRTFFLLNSIALEQQQGGTVRLQLKLETYQRS